MRLLPDLKLPMAIATRDVGNYAASLSSLWSWIFRTKQTRELLGEARPVDDGSCRGDRARHWQTGSMRYEQLPYERVQQG